MGGMNKDLSTSSFKEDTYFDAQNIRVISGDDTFQSSTLSAPTNDTGNVANIKGTTECFRIPNNGKVVGETKLGDNLILLASWKGTVTEIVNDSSDGGFVFYEVSASDHGLSVNDIICFKNTNSFDNEIFIVVDVPDDDTFTFKWDDEFATGGNLTEGSSSLGEAYWYVPYGRSIYDVVFFGFNPSWGFVYTVTCPNHGLTTGESVYITGTGESEFDSDDPDDWHRIANVDIDHFYIATLNFVADKTGLTSAYASTLDSELDKIYRIPFDILDDNYTEVFELTNQYYFISNNPAVYDSAPSYYDALVYRADLGLNPRYPLDVVSNFETEFVQKIYWADGFNQLRNLNIVHNNVDNNLITLDPDLTNMVPSTTHTSIDARLQDGGSLKTGKIQYSYQLYVKHGAETMFSPCSNLLNLTPYASTPPNNEEFRGGDLSDVVNKSAIITIDIGTAYEKFNRLRLVALEYESYEANPTVRIVTEVDIADDTITLYDYGYSIGSLTLDSFRIIQNELRPYSLVTKNNYLIAGNVKQKYFDAAAMYEEAVASDTTEDVLYPYLDMRAYRWKNVAVGAVESRRQYLGDNALAVVAAGTYIPQAGTWILTIGPLSAESDAADPLYVPARTFTSIDLNSVVELNQTIQLTIGTDRILFLLRDYDTGESLVTLTYEEYGNDTLTIRGYAYGIDSSSVIVPGYGPLPVGPSQEYPMSSVVGETLDLQFSYYYNYTIAAGAGGALVCELNYTFTNQLVVDHNNYEAIPLDDDCINTYNDTSNDGDDAHNFTLKLDGTLGGEGPLIEYEFYTQTLGMGSNILKQPGSHRVLINTAPYENYINTETCKDFVGYMRDEVYRFGIVFYDLQLRPSFVNWIGDIRMPTYSQLPPFEAEEEAEALGVQFTVNWTSFPLKFREQISGFRIVRAPRRSADRTIKFQGIMSMVLKYTSGGTQTHWSSYYMTTGTQYQAATGGSPAPIEKSNCYGGGVADADWTYNHGLLEMFSPELSFNKEFFFEASDNLQVVGMTNPGAVCTFDKDTYDTVGGGAVAVYRDVTFASNCVTPVSSKVGVGGPLNPNTTLLSFPELKDPANHNIGGEMYCARGSSANTAVGDKVLSYKGTSLLVLNGNNFTHPDITGSGGVIVANFKRLPGHSIYGGATFEQRSITNYIPCGEFRSVEATPGAAMYVFGGDTYLTYYNFLKLFADPDEVDGNGTWQTYVTFPVETAINTDWRNDQLQKYITFDSGADVSDYHLNENSTWGIEDYPATYPDIGNLYVYNSVYSCWDNSYLSMPEPFDFSGVDYYGNRVTSSDHKIANEYTDSWLKFRYSNYLDTESRYGNIIRLINFNNNVVFFQSKAIGSLAIEERELIESQNVGSLTLGTGGVLSRYDYITTSSGCLWPRAITLSEGNIYYFDYYNKNLRRIVEGGTEPVSELKGLKTFFNSNITDSSDIILGYDRENREVLCGLSDSLWDTRTIAYSLFTDNFIGFQTFIPLRFIEVGNLIFSSSDTTTFWKHNFGDRGHFYGTYDDSYILYVVNPLKINTSTFHTLEWLTDKYTQYVAPTPVALVPTESVTYVDMWDTYQDGRRLTKETSGAISAFADYSGTVAGTVRVTTVANHNLVDDVYVLIYGTTNYNGDYKIKVIDATSFYLTHAWSGDDAIGTFEHDGYVQRFRKWRSNLLREDSGDARLRDNHLFVKLVYENDSSNQKLVIHPLTTSYLPTKIQ